MTGKEKHEHWARISQVDSKYDFYGCYKRMIYSLVAATKDFVIQARLQKVTLIRWNWWEEFAWALCTQCEECIYDHVNAVSHREWSECWGHPLLRHKWECQNQKDPSSYPEQFFHFLNGEIQIFWVAHFLSIVMR